MGVNETSAGTSVTGEQCSSSWGEGVKLSISFRSVGRFPAIFRVAVFVVDVVVDLALAVAVTYTHLPQPTTPYVYM